MNFCFNGISCFNKKISFFFSHFSLNSFFFFSVDSKNFCSILENFFYFSGYNYLLNWNDSLPRYLNNGDSFSFFPKRRNFFYFLKIYLKIFEKVFLRILNVSVYLYIFFFDLRNLYKIYFICFSGRWKYNSCYSFFLIICSNFFNVSFSLNLNSIWSINLW